jgi:hypothetical protein
MIYYYYDCLLDYRATLNQENLRFRLNSRLAPYYTKRRSNYNLRYYLYFLLSLLTYFLTLTDWIRILTSLRLLGSL